MVNKFIYRLRYTKTYPEMVLQIVKNVDIIGF